MAGHPLRPATRLSLGRPLPYQLADGTWAPLSATACKQAILSRPPPKRQPTYAVLAALSSCCPTPRGRLPTHYSPVRRFTHAPKDIFSLDLHVLSPPLTFALSQDQTLQFTCRVFTVVDVWRVAVVRFRELCVAPLGHPSHLAIRNAGPTSGLRHWSSRLRIHAFTFLRLTIQFSEIKQKAAGADAHRRRGGSYQTHPYGSRKKVTLLFILETVLVSIRYATGSNPRRGRIRLVPTASDPELSRQYTTGPRIDTDPAAR